MSWTAALTLVGYAIGANWHAAEQALRGPSYAIAGIVFLSIAIAAVIVVRRRRRAETIESDEHGVVAQAN